MLPVLKDCRTAARIKIKLFLHIFSEGRISNGYSIDLSCWGIRFNACSSLEAGQLVKLSFIFKSSYVLNAKIVEKVSAHEYRAKFIFDDLNKRHTLDIHIEKEASCQS